MKSSLKRKLSLLSTIGVGFLAVSSGSIATYAWFQANANVNIQTTSTSTTITVSRPDDYAFYAYKGNRLDSWTNKGESFSDDFTTINSSNIALETELTDFNPGDIKTYCVVMSGHDTSRNVSLNITKITSNDAYLQSAKHRYIHGGYVDINIGWAINIYSTVATTNATSGYSSFVISTSGEDKFTYTNNNRSTYLDGTDGGSNSINLTTPIPIYDAAVSSSTVYLYYSVVFMNTNDTLYREVDANGDSLLVPNSESASRQFKIYSERDSALEKSRCNSNCYEGLTFALNTLSLTF